MTGTKRRDSGNNVRSLSDMNHSTAKTDHWTAGVGVGCCPRGMPKRPECSKVPMQLSGEDIHRATHNRPVVG